MTKRVTRQDSFASVRRVMDNIRANLAANAGAFANDIVENIRERTPVDTGWLKNNWTLSIGAPTTKVYGSREDARAGKLDLGAEIDIPGLIFNYNGTDDIYVQNNVHYAQIVNEIHPTRKRFIEDGIEEAIKDNKVS